MYCVIISLHRVRNNALVCIVVRNDEGNTGPRWKKSQLLSERQASLGIMGDLIKGTLKLPQYGSAMIV